MGYYDFNLEKVSDLDLQNKVKKYERYNEPCSYLPLPCKKMWFRSLYPTGKVSTEIVEYDEQHAVAEARVYTDCNADKEAYIGIATATVFFDEVRPGVFMSDAKRYSDMKAQAKGLAATMALSDAGFGLQFSDTTDDPEFTAYLQSKNTQNANAIPEAPLPPTGETADTATPKKRGRKSKAEKEAELAAETAQDGEIEAKHTPVEDFPTEVKKVENEPLSASDDVAAPDPETFEPEIDIDVSSILADVGPYAGQPIKNIAAENPAYILWIVEHSKNASVIAAAKKICREDPTLAAKAARKSIQL